LVTKYRLTKDSKRLHYVQTEITKKNLEIFDQEMKKMKSTTIDTNEKQNEDQPLNFIQCLVNHNYECQKNNNKADEFDSVDIIANISSLLSLLSGTSLHFFPTLLLTMAEHKYWINRCREDG